VKLRLEAQLHPMLLPLLAIAIGLAGVVIAMVGYLTKNTFVLAVGLAFIIVVVLFGVFDEAMIHCRPPNCI
jgi:uncharacterized membrane protein